MMKIMLTCVYVDDQDKALRFYTDVLGFVKKEEFPLGQDRWLTVVSPEEPDGPELSLVPDGHPAVQPFKQALAADGIPVAQGVTFTQEPLQMGKGIAAVLDDTCGNLIQIAVRL
jgi:catechol 2,3-dioxygenase-like lactoylglutathione lyase family enzyme